MAETVIRANRGNEELSYLEGAIDQGGKKKKSKKATPDVVSIKQPKTSLEFGLLFSKGTSQFLFQFVLAVGFLQVSFISYPQKHNSQD